jgi:glyoxylase-like metal-dependent hydrolase (beta-lactamase superfamily II)
MSAHVESGGPAVDRTLVTDDATVLIRKFSVGPMDNNVYVLTDTASGRGLLIDAANDADRILDEVHDVLLEGIVTTHGHGDHWQALATVADATGAPVYIHPADQDMVPREADRAASDGMTITFGGATVTLLHTPGHTPGSVCVLLEGTEGRFLFSGDTLFPGGPGNTGGNQDAFAQIMRSLRERLFTLPDDTQVCPGHGDDTTIGAERPHLDEWQERGW